MEGNQGRKKDTGKEAAAGGRRLNGRLHDKACGGEGSSWTVATWKTVQAGGSRASGTMGSLWWRRQEATGLPAGPEACKAPSRWLRSEQFQL